jgi:hypothetical protein
VCAKYERRYPVALHLREQAMQEWCKAESFEDVQRVWRRLGGLVVLHRYGRQHFALLGRIRHGDSQARELLAARMDRRREA